MQFARMNCDFVAPYYQLVERLCFGRSLERARFAYIRETGSARRALVCGGGDGRFLSRLLEYNPHVQVDFVDLSAKMIGIARHRVAAGNATNLARVTFHIADISSFSVPGCKYDLITTNFFLDCFSDKEIKGVVAHLSAMAAAEVTWMLSDFQEGGGRLSPVCSRAVIRSLYAAFRFTTGLRVKHLPDYVSALKNSGYVARKERASCAGLLFSSVWSRTARTQLDGRDRAAALNSRKFLPA